MKIIHQEKIAFWEHGKLVRAYIAEHRAALETVHGLKWCIARLKLEFAAWKYANRAAVRPDRDLRKLYSAVS